MSEPYRLTASEVVTLMKKGDLTVEDYAKSLLARVKERDHVVKAWAFLDPEFVLLQARKLDQVPTAKRGPLHGIAIGVKDVILTKGPAPFLQISKSTAYNMKQICQQSTTLLSTKMNQLH
jgi:Asp-tRNA(Asn)/Glu-tRNA(Gln) amidotransferase A subunit family amidase